MDMHKACCDVAVVGAGPAGSATARHLANAGLNVMLIERSSFDAPRLGAALSPGVQPLLTALGVWPEFQQLAPLPCYGSKSVWGSGAHSQSHLSTPVSGGWHVDRQAFDRMLADAAAKAGAHLQTGCRVLSCWAEAGDAWVLHTRNESGTDSGSESTLRARFVIDASGRTGVLNRFLGARSIVFDRLVGVAAQIKDASAVQRYFTLLEAVPAGWWHSVPTSGECVMATLMTDGDLLKRNQSDAATCWRTALANTELTRAHVPGGRLSWGPQIVPAMSQRQRRRNLQARWLSVGDAALAVDPICGSGIARALRTAKDASETVIALLAGDGSAIANYEARRNEECTRYLSERTAHYSREQRWPGAAFWKRRQAAAIMSTAKPLAAYAPELALYM
jgi:flavin-dependent dehydrogenase